MIFVAIVLNLPSNPRPFLLTLVNDTLSLVKTTIIFEILACVWPLVRFNQVDDIGTYCAYIVNVLTSSMGLIDEEPDSPLEQEWDKEVVVPFVLFHWLYQKVFHILCRLETRFALSVLVNSFAIKTILVPGTFNLFAAIAFHDAVTMFMVVVPVSFISVTIRLSHHSLTVSFTFFPLSIVFWSILVDALSLARALAVII